MHLVTASVQPSQVGCYKILYTPQYSVNRLSCSKYICQGRLLAQLVTLVVFVYWSTTVTLGQDSPQNSESNLGIHSDDDVVVEDDASITQLLALSVFRETLHDGGLSPTMVVIPGGEFDMGCLTDSGCYEDETPSHKVSLKKFAMSRFEITFEHYQKFAKEALRSVPDDNNWGRGTRPTIYVSWYDAVAYTKWLSSATGATYRLPTEAEWEYAGRAGTDTKYSWGDKMANGMANCAGCNEGRKIEKTTKVGQFKPNPWNLYDMHGNVWEWTLDCWNRNYGAAPNDGSAWTTGDCVRRVVRGGSWMVSPFFVRSATRNFFSADNRVSLVGFRVVRELPSKHAEDS